MLSDDLRLGLGDYSLHKSTLQHFEKQLEDQMKDISEKEMSARKEELWGSDTQELSLEACFDLYNRLYDEQQKIIESEEDVDTLTLGLLSFPALEKLTVSSETWRLRPLFPKYETPFFRSLPPGFQMPQLWPWLGRDCDELSEEHLDKLLLPWDDNHEEWRGYQIAVDQLLVTAAHHKVREFVIDTNYELTGISCQIFDSPENAGYITTMRLFQAVQLTTFELCLNVETAQEAAFSCFRNGLLKAALSQLTALKHVALSTSIDTMDDDHYLKVSEGWLSLDEILPVEIWSTKLESLKLCNLLLHGESLYDTVSAMTSLTTIWLDCVSLTDELTWRDLMFRIKNDLVPSSRTWTSDRPDVVFRRKVSSLDLRLDSSAEVRAFLYGEGDCPFTAPYPTFANAGWIVNNWDPKERHYMGPLGAVEPDS